MCDPMSISTLFTDEAAGQLREGMSKIQHCLAQLDDQQVWWRPHEAQNSIANLMLHLDGNLRQWIISGFGGEADVRNRPHEFAERGPIPAEALWQQLAATVDQAIQVLRMSNADRLLAKRRVQSFETTGLAAVFHSVAHFHGHVQEIISLTRQQLGDAYQFAFVPQTKEQGA